MSQLANFVVGESKEVVKEVIQVAEREKRGALTEGKTSVNGNGASWPEALHLHLHWEKNWEKANQLLSKAATAVGDVRTSVVTAADDVWLKTRTQLGKIHFAWPIWQKAEQKAEKEKASDLSMKPLDLNRMGAPRLNVIFLVLALVGAGILAFLFVRELALRQKSISALALAEQARVKLEESVDQLRTAVAEQRDEIARLASDLKAANAKATIVDTLQQDHQAELARLKGLYEGQITSLRSFLEVRDDLINGLQSNLQAIRNLLEHGTVGAMVPTSVANGEVGVRPELASEMSAAGLRPRAGNVVLVERNHRFIILNLGPADGAQMGRFVQIYQKGQAIGQGRIDRVYQNLSAATILSEDTLERVEKGDQVFIAL